MKQDEIIINAEDLPLGRIAAFVAKQALLGVKVTIANCEKAIISGNKQNILEKYRQKRARGTPFSGPFIRKSPEAIVKRAVRGMIPYKKGKGREAFQRVRCVTGPLDGMVKVEIKSSPQKSITVGRLSKLL